MEKTSQPNKIVCIPWNESNDGLCRTIRARYNGLSLYGLICDNGFASTAVIECCYETDIDNRE